MCIRDSIYRALNTVTKTRVLQLPSIVTTDNEEATIQVLEEQATTDSTTSSGGNVSGGFQSFQEAGTTLAISPHIANDDYLLLNINLEVSVFLGEPKTLGTIQIPADRLRRNIQTAVMVPNRHTVVIGGLIGQQDRGEVDQVPYLGQIPILGELFKSTLKSNRETNLFLFVTPTILKATVPDFSDYDQVTCDRKRKADELIGHTEIPFSNFVGCPDTGAGVCKPGCGTRVVVPGTVVPGTVVDPGCVRGSGSASERLEQSGYLDATSFRGPSPDRLKAEAEARRRAMEGASAGPSGGK